MFKRLFRRAEKPATSSTPADLEDPAVAAPGWAAIDRAVAQVYGDQVPKHYGTLIGFALGGPDPLDGVSIFRNDGDAAHWHYVSYGLSDLYQKASDDPAVSGWGIELTFRLRRDGVEAPIWPMNLMQNLARYVFETGNVLLPNHHVDANGPISHETPTELTALLFTEDPELGKVETPNGSVQFVQLAGITGDELEAIREWSTPSFVELWRHDNPLLITDVARRSLLSDPRFASAVAEGSDREGSTLEGLHVSVLTLADEDGAVVTIGAIAVSSLRALLVRRVARGQDAWMTGPDAMLVLRPGTTWGHSRDGDRLVLTLPPELATRLSETLEERAGTYRLDELMGLTVAVQQTVVKDQTGNEIRRIG